MTNTEAATGYAEMFRQLSQDILEELQEICDKDQTSIWPPAEQLGAYAAYLANVIWISGWGCDYFSQLIPRSVEPPAKPYTEDGRKLDLMRIEQLKSQLLGSSRRRKVSGSRDIVRSRVLERLLDRSTYQALFRRFKRTDGGMIIDETVENYLLSDGEVNLPNAYVSVIDRNGRRLDLNLLLPAGYRLYPNMMIDGETEYDPGTNRQILHTRKVSLKNYRGKPKLGIGFSFSANGSRRVSYGDLAETGGILALLHEMAHAWQDVYYGRLIRVDLSDLRVCAGAVISTFLQFRAEREQEIIDEDQREVANAYLARRLAEYGVSANGENLVYSGEALEGDQVVLRFVSQRFIVRSVRAGDLYRAYVREERDASAHAIRMLRYLRRNGFDLEPGLKSATDIRNLVNRWLMSYQELESWNMQIADQRFKFTRHVPVEKRG